jgi:hypothetical protein
LATGSVLRSPVRRVDAKGSTGFGRSRAVRVVADRTSGGGRLGASVHDHADRPDALDQLRRHLVTPTLRAEHLLQVSLEVGVAGTRGALPEVALDLHAIHAHELTVEVELDLAQDVLAVSP